MTRGQALSIQSLVFASPTTAQSATTLLRQDPIDQIMRTPDGCAVTLDPVYVDTVIGDYAFVRYLWSGSRSIAVRTTAPLSAGSSVQVTGYTSTLMGKRIIISTQIRLYVDDHGRPIPPMPLASLYDPSFNVFLTDLQPTTLRSMALSSTDDNILPPLPTDPPANPAPTSAPANSIARAKLTSDTTSPDGILTGKVVTAVLYTSPGIIDCFYIQEPNATTGIKVKPRYQVPVQAKDIVTVEGTLVPGTANTAECYIDATIITRTGLASDLRVIGLTGKSAAGGSFGSQQAIYRKTIPSTPGTGLNAIGTRARLWGKVTAVAANSAWIDDGSALNSTSGGTKTGIKVIFDGQTTCPAGFTLNNVPSNGVTGILGAEMSTDTPPRPIPVLRVPKPAPSAARVIYVREFPAGNDTNNTGSSWSDSVATVEKAIQLANSGDEIWVSAGTYTCHATITKSISLYGGFAGTETSRDQRTLASPSATILDGANSAEVIIVTDNAGVRSTVRIDGFTIQNGLHASALGLGGGVVCDKSSITIANNTFYSNQGADGGAVSCRESTAIIWSNTFGHRDDVDKIYSNHGSSGSSVYLFKCLAASVVSGNVMQYEDTLPASIYAWGRYDQNGGGSIVGNTLHHLSVGAITVAGSVSKYSGIVAHNKISHFGHCAILCGQYTAEVDIASNTIQDGDVGRLGSGIAIWCCDGSSPNVTGNIIQCNASTIDNLSTAISVDNGASPTITGNTIIGNTNTDPGLAGAAIMCNQDCNPKIESNIFKNNTATHGGAIGLDHVASAIIRNNLFIGNHATGEDGVNGGGAIYSTESSNVKIINNTFVDNWVGTGTWPSIAAAAFGGAIQICLNASTPATVVNNVFYGNRALLGNSVACTEGGVADVSYCDAWPGTQQDNYRTATNGQCRLGALTLYLYPSFFDLANDMLWLSSTSALRDQSNRGQSNAVNPDVPLVDLGGRLRSGLQCTDMGAYESIPGNYP